MALRYEVWLEFEIGYGPVEEVDRDLRVGLGFIKDLEEEKRS